MKSYLIPAIVAALAVAGVSANATTTYALTNGGHVLTFDHATPGAITNDVTATPAVVGAYTLLAIDVRPTIESGGSNPGAGTLWAIGKDGTTFQLFVIDPATGETTAIGLPYLAGISDSGVNTWGFDFNPAVDRIRLVSSAATNNNFRLNPNNANGVVTAQDGNLAFQAGDPNAGTTPELDGAAYTTTVIGGATTLYGLDTNLGILVASSNPNAGTLQTVGALGVAVDEPNGFDIFQSLALFSVPTATGASLYSVNLTTGQATLVGDFPAGSNIRGLAISISDPVPPPGPPTLRVFGKKKRTVKTSYAIVRGKAADDSGVVALSYRVINRGPTYHGAPYSDPFSIKVRRLEFGTNRVNIRAIDPDGNRVVQRLKIVRRHKDGSP